MYGRTKDYSKPNPNKPWQRLAEESKEQFDLFWAYCQVRGKRRIYADVAEEAQKYIGAELGTKAGDSKISKLATRAHWKERAEAFDAWLQEKEEGALAEMARAQKMKRAEVANLLLDKVKEILVSKLESETPPTLVDVARIGKIANDLSRAEFEQDKKGAGIALAGIDFRLIIDEKLAPLRSLPEPEPAED